MLKHVIISFVVNGKCKQQNRSFKWILSSLHNKTNILIEIINLKKRTSIIAHSKK